MPKIRTAREKLHARFMSSDLSITQLAERVDLDRSMVSRKIRGETTMTIEEAELFARELGATVKIEPRARRRA